MPLNYTDASITTVDGNFTVSDDPIAVTDGSEWPTSNFTVKVWDGSDPAVLKAVILVGARSGDSLSSLTWNFGDHTDVNIADGDYIALNETRRDFENWRYAASPADKPPDTPNALDDEFNGTSFNTSLWTWRNQGGASAAVSNGRLLLTGTSQAGIEWRIVEQTAPSTPWTVTGKISGQIYNANFASGGLIALDSVSGRLIRWGPSWDNPWRVQVTRYTNVTTFSTHSFTSTFGLGHVTPAYIRIEDNGTNLIFYWSADGLTYSRVYSEGRTAFLTNGADRIGIGVHAESSPPVPAVSCDWFRVNWTPDYVG